MSGMPTDGAKWYEKIIIYTAITIVFVPVIVYNKIKDIFKKRK